MIVVFSAGGPHGRVHECMTGGDWGDFAGWRRGHCGGLELCVERWGVERGVREELAS